MNKVLAKVDNCDLYIEDHGILTLSIGLDKEDGMYQGFGGYALDTYNEQTEKREGSASGTDFILEILRLFGVDRLDKIKGKNVYALYDGSTPRIIGLEVPKFEGGRKFLIKDWCKKWGFEE